MTQSMQSVPNQIQRFDMPSCVHSVVSFQVFRFGFAAKLVALLVWLATTSPSTHAQDASQILALVEDATTSAIARAEPSVVAIARTRKERRSQDRNRLGSLRLDAPLDLNDPIQDPDFVPRFFGSGVIVSEDGFIVTCSHLLGDPKTYDYHVWLNRKHYRATVVSPPSAAAVAYASDPFSDLAVLKIQASGLTPIEFADTNELKKGKFVIALGNPDAIARDGAASASWGIVSNLSRLAPARQEDEGGSKESIHRYGTLIQTDAKSTLGTSGGALIDLQGKMVGLTTSLRGRQDSESAAGFAIATDELFRQVLESLKKGKLPEYGFLGVQPEPIDPFDRERGIRGVRIGVVIPGLPGEQAGLEQDDIVSEVDGKPVDDRNELFRELSTTMAGETVRLNVLRNAGSRSPQRLVLTATVSKKPLSTFTRGYSIHVDGGWQGMVVDYSSAIPSELSRMGLWRHSVLAPQIAVREVNPDTPAWNAGIRPGVGITAVNGRKVSSPAEFYAAVRRIDGSTAIALVDTAGKAAQVSIPALSADSP